MGKKWGQNQEIDQQTWLPLLTRNIPHRESEATPSLSQHQRVLQARYLQGEEWTHTSIKTAEINQDC